MSKNTVLFEKAKSLAKQAVNSVTNNNGTPKELSKLYRKLNPKEQNELIKYILKLGANRQ